MFRFCFGTKFCVWSLEAPFLSFKVVTPLQKPSWNTEQGPEGVSSSPKSSKDRSFWSHSSVGCWALASLRFPTTQNWTCFLSLGDNSQAQQKVSSETLTLNQPFSFLLFPSNKSQPQNPGRCFFFSFLFFVCSRVWQTTWEFGGLRGVLAQCWSRLRNSESPSLRGQEFSCLAQSVAPTYSNVAAKARTVPFTGRARQPVIYIYICMYI